VLDEPTAALDAETEHALFERYAAAARRSTPRPFDRLGGVPSDVGEREPQGRPEPRRGTTSPGRESGDGQITILVSHRFSTVRMADVIVVMDGARLVELGTHDELVAKGGQYAELYGIQAAAYR
jgi:ATP-binding cassette, subfamily B, bacterial